MNKKTISIIIPLYNSERTIQHCIESVLNQTYRNFEIIIIDDESSDNSKKICSKLATQNNQIKIISQKNKGPSSARNLGLANCNGEYLFFIDSDDYIEKDCLEKLIVKIEEDASDICICGYNIVNGNNKKRININNDNNLLFSELIFDGKANIFGYTWGKLVRKNLIDRKFKNDISIKEDQIFWLDNSKNIKKISIVNEPLYNYIFNPNSLLNKKEIDLKRISCLKSNEYIINSNASDNIKSNEIYEFLNNYLLFKAIANNNILSVLNKDYKDKFDNYYREFMQSNSSRKSKIKLFIKRRFFLIYKLLKK